MMHFLINVEIKTALIKANANVFKNILKPPRVAAGQVAKLKINCIVNCGTVGAQYHFPISTDVELDFVAFIQLNSKLLPFLMQSSFLMNSFLLTSHQ